MNEDEYVVLWSPQQNTFAVDTVGEMLRRNREIFERKQEGAFIVLAVHASLEEARQTCSRLMATRLKWEQEKDLAARSS